MFYELLLAITTELLPSLFQLVHSSPPMAFWGENCEKYWILCGYNWRNQAGKPALSLTRFLTRFSRYLEAANYEQNTSVYYSLDTELWSYRIRCRILINDKIETAIESGRGSTGLITFNRTVGWMTLLIHCNHLYRLILILHPSWQCCR